MGIGDFEKMVQEIGVEKAKEYLESIAKKESFPRLQWSVQPMAIKVMLKHLETTPMAKEEIKIKLQKLNLIENDNRDYNIMGLIKWNIGLWETKGNKVQLTKVGKEIAEAFNNDFSRLTVLERVIIMGLLQDTHIHAFLYTIFKENDWKIKRSDLLKEMNVLLPKRKRTGHKGTQGDWSVGYCKTTFERLGILKSFKINGETYYKLDFAN